MVNLITELFCFIDDFCIALSEQQVKLESNTAKNRPTRTPGLSVSEIVTISLLPLFLESKFTNFKHAYIQMLYFFKKELFPAMPTYERFKELQKSALPILLLLFRHLVSQNKKTDCAYVDSTPLRVCKNKRIFNHKVFKGWAPRGKSTIGWFFGLKLHLGIDLRGNIIGATIHPGNKDDRSFVEQLFQGFKGAVFADKGDISKELFLKLWEQGIKLVTGVKTNMKNILMSLKEKILLRKRSLIESVFSVLKRKFDLEHSRHRSITGFFIHVVSVLIAYQMQSNKPAIKMDGYDFSNP